MGRKRKSVEKKKRVRNERKTDFKRRQKKDFRYNDNIKQYKEAARGQHGKINGESLLDIKAGPRYVYFSTLLGEPNTIYKDLGAQGLGLVSNAASALAAGGQESFDSTQQQIQKIQNYVNMIGEAAANQRSLQASFLEKVRRTTQKSKLKTFIESNLQFINPNDPKNFDYKKFIVLLNQAQQQMNNFTRERRKILTENAQLIEHNIQEHKGDQDKIRKQVNEAMQSGYGSYLKKLREYDLLLTQREGKDIIKQFRAGIHDQMASSLKTLMNQLGKNKYILSHIKQMVQNALANQGKFATDEQIVQQIKATAVDWIINSENLTSTWNGSLIENFQAYYELKGAEKLKIYTKEQIAEITEVIIDKSTKSLEQAALITRKGVGQLFARLDKTLQLKILRKYGQIDEAGTKSDAAVELERLRKIYMDSSSSKTAQEKAIRETGKIVQEIITKQFKGFQEATLAQRKKKFNAYKSQVKNFISPITYQKSFEQNFKVRIDSSTLSQRLQAEFMNRVARNFGGHKAHVMGKKVTMKTDIGFTYQFDQFTELGEQEVFKKISDDMSNFTENFVTRYSKNTQNEINVTAGQEAYLKQQDRIVDLIKRAAAEQGVDQDTALDGLKNFFFTQISQKQYNMGGGFGFQGGSLGTGGAPQGVLDNIYEMYSTGGISPIDKQTLYFAAINCSQSALGAELKIPLQQYLLGGAALMMFDSGFTATTNFLERMKKELGFNARGSLHLFALEGGRLIPASFLYTTIYKALTQAYQGIVNQFDKPLCQVPKTTNKVTVSNSLSTNDIPSFTSAPIPQDRWNFIKDLAQSSVKISFIFLGGMLDIFEAIEKAYYVQ